MAIAATRVTGAPRARREGRQWAEQDVRDSERLLGRLLALLQAGRLEAAARLCRDVGQPWRAAWFGSGGGGAALGLVPVGDAAAEADAGEIELGLEALAGEVELGGGTLRSLWRWACFQARPVSDILIAGTYWLHPAATHGQCMGAPL